LTQKRSPEFLDHVKKEKKLLEENGFRVIDPLSRSPHLIAVKDNKIYAVVVPTAAYQKGHGWHRNRTLEQIREDYQMFDDIIVKTFKKDTPS